MAEGALDRIEIEELRLSSIIGVFARERTARQEVILNVVLHADLRAACASDRIEDTVDYKAIKDRIVELVEASSFRLVERLAQAVAEACLADPKVRRVEVNLQKPGALRRARSVGVRLVREAGAGRAEGCR